MLRIRQETSQNIAEAIKSRKMREYMTATLDGVCEVVEAVQDELQNAPIQDAIVYAAAFYMMAEYIKDKEGIPSDLLITLASMAGFMKSNPKGEIGK